MGKKPDTEPREEAESQIAPSSDFSINYVVTPLRGIEPPVIHSEVLFSELRDDGKYWAWVESPNGTMHCLNRDDGRIDKDLIGETRARLLARKGITPTVYVLLEGSDKGPGRRH